MGRSESYRSSRRKPELNPLTEVYQPVEIQNEFVRLSEHRHFPNRHHSAYG
jgi:hypothetical protein